MVNGQHGVVAGAGRGVDVVVRSATVEVPPGADSGTGEVNGAAGGRAAGDSAAAAVVAASGVGVGFPAGDGIRVLAVTGVQTCALPIYAGVVLHVDAVAVRRQRHRDRRPV